MSRETYHYHLLVLVLVVQARPDRACARRDIDDSRRPDRLGEQRGECLEDDGRACCVGAEGGSQAVREGGVGFASDGGVVDEGVDAGVWSVRHLSRRVWMYGERTDHVSSRPRARLYGCFRRSRRRYARGRRCRVGFVISGPAGLRSLCRASGCRGGRGWLGMRGVGRRVRSRCRRLLDHG
jgi:hypothetical protein